MPWNINPPWAPPDPHPFETGLREGQMLALAPLRIQQAQNAVKEQQLGIYQMGLENRAKSAMLDNQIKSLDLKVQEQNLAVKSQQEQMAAWQQDAPKLTAWMALPAEQKITTDPGVTSQKGLQLFELGLNAAQAQVYRKQDSEMRTNAILDRQRMIEENKTALEGFRADTQKELVQQRGEFQKQIAELQANRQSDKSNTRNFFSERSEAVKTIGNEISLLMEEAKEIGRDRGFDSTEYKEKMAELRAREKRRTVVSRTKTTDQLDEILGTDQSSSIVPTPIPEGTAPRVVGKVTLDGQFIPAK